MSGYFPPPSGGDSGLTFPTGTSGLTAGMIGLEMNGSAQALGASLTVTFDTLYADPATSDSDALSGDVETDDFTFKTTGIDVEATGLYAIAAEVDFSAAPSVACVIKVSGPNGGEIVIPVPAGVSATAYNFHAVVAVNAARTLSLKVTNVNAGDAAKTVTYASLAVTKLAG